MVHGSWYERCILSFGYSLVSQMIPQVFGGPPSLSIQNAPIWVSYSSHPLRKQTATTGNTTQTRQLHHLPVLERMASDWQVSFGSLNISIVAAPPCSIPRNLRKYGEVSRLPAQTIEFVGVTLDPIRSMTCLPTDRFCTLMLWLI